MDFPLGKIFFHTLSLIKGCEEKNLEESKMSDRDKIENELKMNWRRIENELKPNWKRIENQVKTKLKPS